MVRRDGSRVRCFTRNGHDWADRFPAIVEAAARLKRQSFLIDGEAVIVRKRRQSGNPTNPSLARRSWDEWTPPGPAFGRPDDKLRDTHQWQFATMMGFANGSTILLRLRKAVTRIALGALSSFASRRRPI